MKPPQRRKIVQGISFPDHTLHRLAQERIARLGISWATYVQQLIRTDLAEPNKPFTIVSAPAATKHPELNEPEKPTIVAPVRGAAGPRALSRQRASTTEP